MDESGISNPNQLAKLSGIPQPVVRRIYIGEAKDPRKDTLQRFADFFGVDVDSFRTVKPNIPTQLPTTSSGTYTAQKVAREIESLSESGKLSDEQIKSISSLIKTFTED